MAALFDSDFLKKLEYLSLISRRVFRGQILAQRRTMQMGGGIEFADHREYTPGDDFRYLDWNLYARHEELLLKRFQERYPQIQQLKTDPWGHPYQYRFPGQNNPNGYDLWSMGKDGRDGGNDDIDNWSQAQAQ